MGDVFSDFDISIDKSRLLLTALKKRVCTNYRLTTGFMAKSMAEVRNS
jgi:hypothetical protein